MILVFILMIVELRSFGASEPLSLFLSPTGSDDNDGLSILKPLLTFEAAFSLINEPDHKDKDVVIELMCGTCGSSCFFNLQSTLQISNPGNRLLTIRAFAADQVHITGGTQIPSSAFKPLSAGDAPNRLAPEVRPHVLKVDLPGAGITNLGNITVYGYYVRRIAPLEIFENFKPLTLARYPNKEEYVNVDQPNVFNDDKSFTYTSDRPLLWGNEDDVWCHGFWYWGWADKAYRAVSINPNNRTVVLSEKVQYGIRKGYYDASDPAGADFHKQGGNFRFVNVLHELDEAGEYYVDRLTSTLYVWPLKDAAYTSSDVIQASIIDDCIEITAGSSNIVLQGFTLEACRRFGIVANRVQNLTVTAMRIQNLGSYGLTSRQSTNVKIERCDIRDTDGGIDLFGGDRRKLTPSGHEICDNIITNSGRVSYVGSDSINLHGVGVHVHHNMLVDAANTGIHWLGNDHIFEHNYLYRMCWRASDCGGFMTGRDWTGRGIIIRNNHIQNTRRHIPGADVRGIMLDDQYSSTYMVNNVFDNNDVHILIAGGRDNIVKHNIFSNAQQYSLNFDDIGAEGTNTSSMIQLYQLLAAMPYRDTLWKERYPKLYHILDDGTPGKPEGNQIVENIFYSAEKKSIHGRNFGSDWFNVTDNIFIGSADNFYAPEYGNFYPRCLLDDFVKQYNFPIPVLPDELEPRTFVGPLFSAADTTFIGYKDGYPPVPAPCFPKSPKPAPKPIYLPDGTSDETAISGLPNEGCLFIIDKCVKIPKREKHRQRNGYYRNKRTEKDGSGTNETACLERVPEMMMECGLGSEFQVVYGPTGASTLGGDGCYFATWGCPTTGSTRSGYSRDTWVELHRGGADDEDECLSRARNQWHWCEADKDFPLTLVYRPTGHYSAAGFGCWIRPERCPADETLSHRFYDGYGAANYATDYSIESCFARAKYFWELCGSYQEYKVYANFRSEAKTFVYPGSVISSRTI